MFKSFPFYMQLERADCGPSCIRMIAKYYGKKYSLKTLRELCHLSTSGTSMLGLKLAAEEIGFSTKAISIPHESQDGGIKDVPLPFIAFWKNNHYVVVYKFKKGHVYIADPAKGKLKISENHFKENWLVEDDKKGIALLLVPNEKFHSVTEPPVSKKNDSLGFFLGYLKPYTVYALLLLISLLIGSSILLMLPYLTKSIVDSGIGEKNIQFIYLVLLGQVILYASQTILNFFQRWVLMQISSRMNIVFATDFLVKLTKLPITFFDNRYFGELFQRISDHRKIEAFVNNTSINILFSTLNIIIFGAVLYSYNVNIFLLYVVFSLIYGIWIYIFIKKRKLIDYRQFDEYSQNTDMLIELIQGMQEIKLQNSESKRSKKWSESQGRLFKLNLKSMALNQYQEGGAFLINQTKDMLITILSAIAVIEGSLSLGELIAVQFVLGQLNSPVQQIVSFIRLGSESKLSLERIKEIHEREEEDDSKTISDISTIELKREISMNNISFRYNKLHNYVINDLSLTIPYGKRIAIVGSSGSGKTTLVKLLLGMYQPEIGTIKIGEYDLSEIKSSIWRSQCGAVMQDGYIFKDTIARNIAESDEMVDKNKLSKAIEIANITDIIESKALGLNTEIGSQLNISQGQKQRILIARAVYKDPNFLFFDEATNALDAKNELEIVNKLEDFYREKTAIIVAHRLSTVKNADLIFVMEKGSIVESGNHKQLVEKKGYYYTLVKNQLELGN